MTSLANGGNALQAINNNFAEGNRGFQAGTITGHANVEFHHYAPERPETPPTPLSTILPFDRDPDYVERGSLLEDIGAKLSRAAARVALVGLGGVGKTQLAIEYAHQQRLQSPETWLLWLYASNGARFEQSVRGVLDQLRVRGRKDPKANVFQLLRNRLCDATKGPWLVILDNADDARVLLGSPSVNDQVDKSVADALPTEARLDYIPKCGHGKVLVTSRSKEAAKELVYSKDVFAIEPMEEEQALELLRKKLDTWYTEQDALRLAQELDYMPLALAQAAAYICQRDGRCSIEQYLDKIGECDISGTSILDVEGRDLRRDRGASNSIMLTWQISFNHIREVRRSAADLLSLMSFFDRQAIPEALLHERGSEFEKIEADRGESARTEGNTAIEKSHEDGKAGVLGDTREIPLADLRDARHGISELEPGKRRQSGISIGSSNEDPEGMTDIEDEDFEEDLKVLRDYSFVSIKADATAFDMHRLVQFAMQRWLKVNDSYERWGSQFISNLDDAFPLGRYEDWGTSQLLFPHAMMALKTKIMNKDAIVRQASLLLHSGLYASGTGAYEDARKLTEKSARIRKRVLGDEHSDTIVSKVNLAVAYRYQGRLREAEELQLEVLETSRRVLGDDHASTMTSKANLAMMYSDQGRWKEAEALQFQVFSQSRRVLEDDHASTMTSKANLASTYRHQGRWKEAETLQFQVFGQSRRVLGDKHPFTMTSMANLASTYRHQGRYNEAEELEVQVCEMRMRVLGDEHPDTMTSKANLALTYRNQGRYNEAEMLAVQVLKSRQQAFGDYHPDTLTSKANLASTVWSQGRHKEAEELEVEVLRLRKKELGDEHPDTMGSKANLASTYWNQGRYKEAEDLASQALESSKRALGNEHPDTITRKASLAAIYRHQGRFKEAEELEVQAFESSKRALGDEHPDTITRKVNLAATYRSQGRYEDAGELVVQALETSKRVLGEEHPDTMTSKANLSSTYWSQGRYNEAEELAVQVLKSRQRAFGDRHPDTMTSKANLASTVWSQGRHKEAEELEVEVLRLRKEVLGDEHPDTMMSKVNLAVTYWNKARRDEAEELMAQALKSSRRVLGNEHPDTITRKVNLAAMYRNQGRHKEAEELAVQALESSKRALGDVHPDTITRKANLACTKKDLGQKVLALLMMKESAEASLRVLGSNHPDSIDRNQRVEAWTKEFNEERNKQTDIIQYCTVAGEEAVGGMGDKPDGWGANVIQTLRSVFTLSLILAGIVTIVAVSLWQDVG